MVPELLRVGSFVLGAVGKVWPLLLITIPFAALVRLTGNTKAIQRVLGRRPLVAIVIATAVGAVSPLCSCGVIPVIAALLGSGVPLGPVMAFWLASPSMDPEIFFLSVSTLGWELAIWRLAATTVMSLVGGVVAWRLHAAGFFGDKLLNDAPSFSTPRWGRQAWTAATGWIRKLFRPAPVPACACSVASAPTVAAGPQFVAVAKPSLVGASRGAGNVGTAAAAATAPAAAARSAAVPTGPFLHRLLREMADSAMMVVKFLLLAYVLEALITLYVPVAAIERALGGSQWFAVPLAVGIGVPLYTTNLSALGIVGGLLAKGMAPGAALAFLVGGATTTIPAMAAVYGIATRRVFVLYVALSTGAALAVGLFYSILG